MKNQIKVLCCGAALVLAANVQAATTWTVASNYGAVSSGVTVTAVSNTGAGNTNADNALGDNQTIQGATWTSTWGGIYNADACGSATGCDAAESDSPEHAIDNNERYDMALLSFSTMVNLTQVKLGWSQTDSDITVLAFTGGGSSNIVGKTYGQLAVANSGWKLIGNYSDVGTAAAKDISAGSAGVYSSFWLIGAYNPLAGSNAGWSLGNDYVKLASVTGNACTSVTPGCGGGGSVPEPGSLVLMGVGLLGLIRCRKGIRS